MNNKINIAFCFLVILTLFNGRNKIEKVNAITMPEYQTLNFTDKNGNRIYTPGGIFLGQDLSDKSVTRRYWDTEIAYSDMYYVSDYYSQELYALISTTHPQANYSTCVSSAIIGTLKGIEVKYGYEDSAYPLFGDKFGRYIGAHNKNNHNFATYWPSDTNIRLSGEYYKDDHDFPLATLSENYNRISYVYNEAVSVGYYAKNYGSGESSISTTVAKYLELTKTKSDYRYRLLNGDTCYNRVSSVGETEAYKQIRKAIMDGVPVMFGDDDFSWANSGNYDNSKTGGHVMTAVGTGIAKVYDNTTKKWYDIPEIIYDQGAGDYAAMPIQDVYDYFLMDVRLQKKEYLFGTSLLFKWVSI